ncbi:MAG TPA: hypothetical protein VHW01_23640 [Polyangiaceae bacterium]|jgi:hypothetical protein|nr:hypothetical protein [Polyangiaceae bacterium]
MFYLSRGGAPEGPFEEARLVYMIQSGELTQGGVCPVGQNQWLELNAVPVFAQALAARRGQPAPQVAAKKSHRRPMIAALVGILLLVLLGTAVGAYVIFFSSGGASSIAKSVPQNSELFVEVPSVHKLVSDLREQAAPFVRIHGADRLEPRTTPA